MNVKLLRKVKKHILAEPKRLVMGDWIQRKAKNHKKVEYDGPDGTETQRGFAKCGTAGCIAGWTLILSGKKDEDIYSFETDAAELLRLDADESDRLFYPGEWPDKFAQGLAGDGKKKTAQVAAARIEHFIKTKGAE